MTELLDNMLTPGEEAEPSDMKLRKLALDAMAEPPGDAPIFSDADELERYLDAL